ncbi:hypothetical protein J7J18_04655 [bacterium]|nr:hypothetical protein [bacterium]
MWVRSYDGLSLINLDKVMEIRIVQTNQPNMFQIRMFFPVALSVQTGAFSDYAVYFQGTEEECRKKLIRLENNMKAMKEEILEFF